MKRLITVIGLVAFCATSLLAQDIYEEIELVNTTIYKGYVSKRDFRNMKYEITYFSEISFGSTSEKTYTSPQTIDVNAKDVRLIKKVTGNQGDSEILDVLETKDQRTLTGHILQTISGGGYTIETKEGVKENVPNNNVKSHKKVLKDLSSGMRIYTKCPLLDVIVKTDGEEFKGVIAETQYNDDGVIRVLDQLNGEVVKIKGNEIKEILTVKNDKVLLQQNTDPIAQAQPNQSSDENTVTSETQSEVSVQDFSSEFTSSESSNSSEFDNSEFASKSTEVTIQGTSYDGIKCYQSSDGYEITDGKAISCALGNVTIEFEDTPENSEIVFVSITKVKSSRIINEDSLSNPIKEIKTSSNNGIITREYVISRVGEYAFYRKSDSRVFWLKVR